MCKGRNRDADTEHRLGDTVGKERVGCIERIAWEHTHHHLRNKEPVGIRSNRCSVTTWRRGMGWGVGGGFKREGTCLPMVDSC